MMLTISMPDGLLSRIQARHDSVGLPISRNSFISSLLIHELDHMDELDKAEGDLDGDGYAMGFVTSTSAMGRKAGWARKVKRVKDGQVFASTRHAADAVGVTVAAMYQAVTGRTKTCAGSRWEYVE